MPSYCQLLSSALAWLLLTQPGRATLTKHDYLLEPSANLLPGSVTLCYLVSCSVLDSFTLLLYFFLLYVQSTSKSSHRYVFTTCCVPFPLP